MGVETMLGTALGSLVGAVKKSKGGKIAIDEISSAVWDFFRPIFVVDIEEEEQETKTLQDLRKDPDDELNQSAALLETKKYLRDHPEKEDTLKALIQLLQNQGGNQGNITNITQHHSGSGDNVAGNKIVG